ncbi:MAG: hypothetical protein HY275_02220 [Gemmatimonadetes bacterium]|nr:hypothetical protein [Gemmatimonadota bacterium]
MRVGNDAGARCSCEVPVYLLVALVLVTASDTTLRPRADAAVHAATDTVRTADTTGRVRADTLRRDTTRVAEPAATPTLAQAEARAQAADTLPVRRRRLVVEYSDAYGTRLTWHRWLSYPIVPLFAAQYYFGEQLMADQRGASDLTKVAHRSIATMTAGIYTANTVTGLMNLWEGRHDPSQRLKKWVHAALFVTADAGFVYGATLAQRAQVEGQDARELHRTVELTSIGISVASWAMMLLWKD